MAPQDAGTQIGLKFHATGSGTVRRRGNSDCAVVEEKVRCDINGGRASPHGPIRGIVRGEILLVERRSGRASNNQGGSDKGSEGRDHGVDRGVLRDG